MQMMFVDESGTAPKPGKTEQNPFFVLGACVIPESYWHQVKAELEHLKSKFKVIGEIKWRYFAPPRAGASPHSFSHMDVAKKEEFRAGLYKIIGKYKSIRILSVVADTKKVYEQEGYIASDDDIYWYVYKQLTERFQYYLQDISKTSGQKINGIIVCDHRAPKDDKRLQELHARLMTGNHAAHSEYHNLIEGLFIAPSHLSVGIQLADMVAGAVLRKVKDDDDRYFSQVVGSFRTSPSGSINGYGLVRFPKG